jgi:hypothetical protein
LRVRAMLAFGATLARSRCLMQLLRTMLFCALAAISVALSVCLHLPSATIWVRALCHCSTSLLSHLMCEVELDELASWCAPIVLSSEPSQHRKRTRPCLTRDCTDAERRCASSRVFRWDCACGQKQLECTPLQADQFGVCVDRMQVAPHTSVSTQPADLPIIGTAALFHGPV